MDTERVTMEFDVPGVTSPDDTDPRDAQIVALQEELNAARDRIAELERMLTEAGAP